MGHSTRNYLFILLSFFLFSSQNSNAQDIDVGARVGLQWANVSGIDSFDTKSKFNFTISGYVLMDLGPVVLNPEIMFEGRGFKYDDPAGFSELKQKLGYLTIPVFVNYYFLGDKMYIQAGPYASFLLSAELNLTGSLGAFGRENKDAFNGTDFGLGFGFGFDLGRVDFGVRYMLGLTDINAIDGAEPASNRVLNFHVGVKILKNRGE
jgi:Outer membrane protein beta-barrel domain